MQRNTQSNHPKCHTLKANCRMISQPIYYLSISQLFLKEDCRMYLRLAMYSIAFISADLFPRRRKAISWVCVVQTIQDEKLENKNLPIKSSMGNQLKCFMDCTVSIPIEFIDIHGNRNVIDVYEGTQIAHVKEAIRRKCTPNVLPQCMTLTNCGNKLFNRSCVSRNLFGSDCRFQQHRKVIHALNIEFQDVMERRSTILIDKEWTGKDLKEHLYYSLGHKELRPNQMSLTIGNKVVENASKINSLDHGGLWLLKQSKESLMRIPVPNASQTEDTFTLENESVKLPCGHSMGRDAMLSFLKYTVTQRKYKLECPHKEVTDPHSPCLSLLDYNLCAEIAVLTATQKRKIQQGLNLNYLRACSRICPNEKCKMSLYKPEGKQNSFFCSSCNHGPFCYRCLNDWINTDDQQNCKNQICRLISGDLNFPQTKELRLKDPKDLTWKKYSVPFIRVCDNCRAPYEHIDGCKHIICLDCAFEFCWICLGTPKNGRWKCGKAFDFCGQIAPPQRN